MRTLVLAAALIGLAACQQNTYPPGDPGVCYHVVMGPDGEPKYNKLVDNVPNLETCAANLEAMRLRFLGMGGSNQELTGAYQGSFLYLRREGVFTAPTLERAPYLALVRTGDGRLAIPGAMPMDPADRR